MGDRAAEIQQGIRCAADIIRSSKRAIVLTGAGISTPSGVPDFRSSPSGLWQRYDPVEVASLQAFRRDPEKFYHWMRPLARRMVLAKPNVAHIGLAVLERAGFIKTLITQNIDTLHQRAGTTQVLEVHGTLRTLSCLNCYRHVDSSGYLEDYVETGCIPHCPQCNGVLKPDIILFGEQLPARTWLKAQEASKECDLMLVAGSSLEVLPVAGLPMRSLESGAHLIIINQSPTYIDIRADIVFTSDVIEIIPRLVTEVLGA